MLSKLRDIHKEYGLLLGLLYGLDRVLQRLSPRLRLYPYRFMVQPITGRPLLPERLAGRLEVREIRRGDPEVALMPARPDIKESRFAQQAVCLGAFRGGRLVGYLWFCFRAYDEDEVRCTYLVTPQNEAVFDFDVYIFPEHRMGLAFAALWDGASRYFRSRGIRFSFSRLTQFNVASRRSHDRLGWKSVGRALFLRAGPVELMAATVWPYLHLSRTAADRARLRFSPPARAARGSMTKESAVG